MSRLQAVRPEKRAGGAFGRRPSTHAEYDERDAFRAHVTAAVSSVWSYDEIQAFGDKAQRDRERLQEILELFEEANDPVRYESAHFEVHQWRLAQKRERYAEARKLDPATFKRTRAQAKVRYERWLARHPRPKQAKLTAAQARDIRFAYQRGFFQVDLAVIYGVHVSTIHLLLKGRTWKRAGGPTIERATRTHRRVPLVVDVESKREGKRKSQAAWRAKNPGYHAGKERERRERDPEAQRAKDRARYAARATEIQAHRRAKQERETPAEREARLAEHRKRCKRYYERHREEVLERQKKRADQLSGNPG